MLNCFAAALTVALFSIMYSARSQARSSILVYTCTTPQTHIVNIYDGDEYSEYMKMLYSDYERERENNDPERNNTDK